MNCRFGDVLILSTCPLKLQETQDQQPNQEWKTTFFPLIVFHCVFFYVFWGVCIIFTWKSSTQRSSGAMLTEGPPLPSPSVSSRPALWPFSVRRPNWCHEVSLKSGPIQGLMVLWDFSSQKGLATLDVYQPTLVSSTNHLRIWNMFLYKGYFRMIFHRISRRSLSCFESRAMCAGIC